MKKVNFIIIYLLVSLSLIAPQSSQADFKPQVSERMIGIFKQSAKVVLTPTSTPSPTPVPPMSARDSAREWLAAVANEDEEKLLSLTCAARQDELKQTSPWSLAFVSLEEWIVELENLKVDTTQLTLGVPEPNETRVKVHVDGRRVNIIGRELGYGHTYEWRTFVRDIEAQWWLVQEAGQWRWCGAIQGEFPPTPHPSPTPRPVRSAQSGTASTGIWGYLNGFLGFVFGCLLPLLAIIGQLGDYLNRRKSKT